MSRTKTILSAALAVIVFGASIVTADAHGPGNGPANHSGPSNNPGNKPIKTSTNSTPRQMQHRKHAGDANDIDPGENDDVCKWIKKNGRDVKVCTPDDE